MNKTPLQQLEEVAVMAKSHVAGYTRKDGAFVKEHDDARTKKFNHPGDAQDHHMSTEGAYRAQGFKVKKRVGGKHGEASERKFGMHNDDEYHEMHFEHEDGRQARLKYSVHNDHHAVTETELPKPKSATKTATR